MSVKLYLLLCDYCGYKRITDGTDAKDLIEVKTAPLMTKIPTLDPITHKTVPGKFKQQKKRFKCPKCGRLLFPRKLKDESSDTIRHQTGDEGSPI